MEDVYQEKTKLSEMTSTGEVKEVMDSPCQADAISLKLLRTVQHCCICSGDGALMQYTPIDGQIWKGALRLRKRSREAG